MSIRLPPSKLEEVQELYNKLHDEDIINDEDRAAILKQIATLCLCRVHDNDEYVATSVIQREGDIQSQSQTQIEKTSRYPEQMRFENYGPNSGKLQNPKEIDTNIRKALSGNIKNQDEARRYLYVFSYGGANVYKIGWAPHIKRLTEGWQRCYPKLELHSFTECPNASFFERVIHEEFAQYRRVHMCTSKSHTRVVGHTEWFEVPLQHILDSVRAWSLYASMLYQHGLSTNGNRLTIPLPGFSTRTDRWRRWALEEARLQVGQHHLSRSVYNSVVDDIPPGHILRGQDLSSSSDNRSKAGATVTMARQIDYTIGIICPLEVEMSAIRYMLAEDPNQTAPAKHSRYICGQLCGHNVVIATLPINSQGKVSTAVAAGELKANFPAVSLFLLVGIGGGVPSQGSDIRLGDVVISTPAGQHAGVVQYDLGKEETGRFLRKGFLQPPPRLWLDVIPRLQSDHRDGRTEVPRFIKELQQRFQGRQFTRPLPDADLLFQPNYPHATGNITCEECSKSRLVQRSHRADATQPVIHYGLIASGDRVIKNALKRDEIAKEAGGAICFEMEAAGLMNDFPCIIIRGICDYCDSHKNNSWHEYAAAAAAAVAKEILGYINPVDAAQPGWQNATGTTSHN